MPAMKLSPGDHTARVNDVQLSYTVRGEGPLLFVTSPGWGIASAYLQRGLAPLEKHGCNANGQHRDGG
jgi:proline iminopeptidase